MTDAPTILQVHDILNEADEWFEAVFMAAAGIGDRQQAAVFQRIAQAGRDKLAEAERTLDIIRKENSK